MAIKKTILRNTPLAEMPPVAVLSPLLESMCKGLGILEDNKIIYANTQFYTIFGLDQATDKSMPDLEAVFQQHTYAGSLTGLLTCAEKIDVEFQSAINQNWYALGVCPHPSQRDYRLLLCSDISAFRRRDELLSFANKMEALGQLAGGVAHDFNNILSIIEGYTRLLLRKIEPENEAYIYLQRMLLASDRGTGLTRQLLAFGTHKVIDAGTICLNEFLQEQQNLLRPLLDSHITLSVNCPSRQVLAAISAEQLSQIMLNAITNARDALNGEKGEIRITVENRPDTIVMTVSDTGCGMDEITLAKAQEPFFTTKPAGKGTGLGLSQIYGILQQTGGSLTINSVIGQGTDLIMHLPHGQKENFQPVSLSGVLNADMKGQTVLIADDEPDLVEVMRQMLEEYGFNVLCAANGNEALEIQDRYPHKIDWLLSDVVMPDMSGPKLGGLIESVRPETRIIYMSGYPATGQMSRITLPKEALFLAKPIDPAQLITIMNGFDQEENRSAEFGGLARLAGTWNMER